MDQPQTFTPIDAAVVAAGPLAIGACLGLGHGTALTSAMRVPVVFALVGAIMIPALYILSAFAGVAPSLSQLLRAAGSGLRAAGILFLGFAPAVLFLGATSSVDQSMSFIGQGSVLIGGILGLRELYRRAYGECLTQAKAVAVFGVWALVSLGIGAHLYVTQVVV